MTPVGIIDAFWLEVPPVTGGGVSGESTIVGQAWQSAYHHYIAAVSREPIQVTFAALAETWKEEKAHRSSMTDIVLQPSYQRIIGLGPRVVPSILNELSNEPDHWFWALSAITGSNPIPPEAAGDLEAMTAAWLTWGREQGVASE